MIEDEQMVAMIVERIEIAEARDHGRGRGRAHFFVKDAVTERLRGVDLFGRHGKAYLKGAKAKLGVFSIVKFVYRSHSYFRFPELSKVSDSRMIAMLLPYSWAPEPEEASNQ
jgi:hypothetical protein